jgi:hypothetical protein
MWAKIALSISVIIVVGFVKAVWFPVAMIGAASMAGGQLASSDPAAVVSVVGMNFFTGMTAWLIVGTLVILVAIWWPSIKRGVTKIMEEL